MAIWDTLNDPFGSPEANGCVGCIGFVSFFAFLAIVFWFIIHLLGWWPALIIFAVIYLVGFLLTWRSQGLKISWLWLITILRKFFF